MSTYGVSLLSGMIFSSNLVYAAGCDAGFVEIDFVGKGVTNTISDPYSAPASLGIVKLKSKGPYNIKLECGVRGVVTTEPEPIPPSYTEVATTFTSYIACGDEDHTEAVIYSDATLQLGYCDGNTYIPGNPINGPFEEPGNIVGKWGLLEGAEGEFYISGISSCGLQEWNVEATVCVKQELAEEF
jgi:hypothetical protein